MMDAPTTTTNFLIDVFCRVDDQMQNVPKHPQARLWPSEVVTLALLYALKGGSARAHYRWLKRDFVKLSPHLPERTRLMRLFKTHWQWSCRFMAQPTLLGVIDTKGIEMIHSCRQGRGLGGGGIHRWIVGVTLDVLLNRLGRVVGWRWAPANIHDKRFRPLIEALSDQMLVRGDLGFHAAEGDPSNLKICPQGQWNGRMLVETIFSMLMELAHLKKVAHRASMCVLDWPLSWWRLMSWYNGMVCLRMKMDLYTYPLLNSFYEPNKLVSLVFIYSHGIF